MDKPSDTNAQGESRTVYETPAVKAIEVIRDPDHPEAGKGGIVPPVETRWKPGQPGNPKGRPSAGASVKEWWNQMREWPLSKVESVLRDKSAPVNKLSAAQEWLSACLGREGAEPGRSVERIIGHTDGKPAQQVQVDHTGEVQHRHRIVLETRSPGAWPEAGETLRLPDPDDDGPKPAA